MSTSIALPTTHPTWCDIESHQSVLDAYADPDLADVRKHFNIAGAGLLLEQRWADRVTRDFGGSWQLSLEQAPFENDDTGGGGWPFIVLFTSEPGAEGSACTLPITTGEARVLAAQLVAAADKVDLS